MRFAVDEEKCTHCGACIATCPTDMVRDKRGAIKISFVACIGCGHCMAICPEGAINLEQIEYEGDFQPMPQAVPDADALLALLQSRRTVRRYRSDPVSRDDLARLIEAARWVPTGANCQCQQFIVVTDPARLTRLRQEIMDHYRRYAADLQSGRGVAAGDGDPAAGQMHEHILAAVPSFVRNVDAGRDRLFFDAPAVIIIHAPRHEVLPEAACAFATLAMALMAETLGLGTCITAYASLALQALPDLAREVGVPDGNEAYYVLVVGHPAERYQLIPPRRPAAVQWL
ncbi:MAG: nitroreductase family protein [Armatimonadetes bacterium]|nr:nitroreductase family protein [Armatimonadota bacterium]